ncbi:hypothetical protein GCK72_005305 [Caenorhabditis remanei]|uniref:Uncharacterized protein n=1 Tax=Caenorhabditis remanei TaxID=31234 RepID=A0A6A5HG85_CAERE|nr:hypothetical protein GCK72_005305 [Caenorhabditis remanei]KAF1765353.1 hypothetical protein GCK72_005305 [Caenorhabditis remanei]
MNVLGKLGNDFSVRFRLELVPLLLKIFLDLTVIGNDTVVNYEELVLVVTAMWMRVNITWRSVSGPTGMCNTTVDVVLHIHVEIVGALLDVVIENRDFSSFTEQCDFRMRRLNVVGSVDSDSSRVVPSVLHSLQSLDQNVHNFRSLLRRQEVEVGEDSAHFGFLYWLVVVITCNKNIEVNERGTWIRSTFNEK